MSEIHLWLNTALLITIIAAQVVSIHRQQWLHDTLLPFLASLPKLIKLNGKGIDA